MKPYLLKGLQDYYKKQKRPVLITLFAWYIIIFSFPSLIAVLFSPPIYSLERHIFSIIMHVIVLVSAIGILKLKIWSVYIYFTINVLNLFTLLFPPENLISSIKNNYIIETMIIILLIQFIIIYKYKEVFK